MTAGAASPEPSRTLAVLFGASRWPEFEALDIEAAASSYAAAAQGFRDYLLGEDGLGVPPDNLLDLFDSPDKMVDQDKQIRNFILRKCKDVATIQDLVVMFVGHGSTTQNNKFIFVLRSTSSDQREITAYGSETLGRTLKKTAPKLRKWIILDCCAAAAAYGDFQPASEPGRLLELDAETSFPPDGAAFYAACSSDNVAYNDPGTGSRMFAAALTHVLQTGDPSLGDRLTLCEVHALTLDEINRRHGPDGIRPHIGDPDQRKGVLSGLPFFPNPARKKFSLETQLKALQSSIAALESSVSGRLEAFGRTLGEQQQQQDAFAKAMTELTVMPPANDAASEVPSGMDAEFRDVETRIHSLSVGDQRWWDESRSGYYFSRRALAASALLLFLEIALCGWLLIVPSSHAAEPIVVIAQRGLTILAVLACLFAAAGIRENASSMFEGSPELDTLLRTNGYFRKIYCARYSGTPYGLVHRRTMIFAFVVCALAGLLGIMVFFLDFFGSVPSGGGG